ncbi:MAG: LppX_LprAFG lipoprotein [Chloroflexota bacterium]|nr:LppX_LprAFG lipoprotein [Chloroflexota bacterium]MDE2962061.1 LppX_LprAFG lipoprotein [Chloroflexota bacterium]
MVHALKAAKLTLSLAALIGIVWTAAACDGAAPAVVAPTPTPVPDPAALLAETAANLRTVQSAKFLVSHQLGSIYLPDFSAKITEISGAWDADAGAELSIDAYLVSGPDADYESGSYVQVSVIITPAGYFATEPISGLWLKQPIQTAPIAVDRLQHIIADFVDNVGNPVLVGQESLEGVATYRISGDLPASAMDWLPLTASASQSLRVEIWTDADQKLLRRLDAIGPVGEFDAPDTQRSILLTNIGEPVTVVPPEQFIDLTGG